MGSMIEINDTLKLPDAALPQQLETDQVYEFELKGRRLYHLSPTRVFLVREIDGKWDYVGHAVIIQLTIDANAEMTRGRFKVQKVYDETYRRMANLIDAPAGKGYVR
jgi:hypothetical protein